MANELFGTPKQEPSKLSKIAAALGGFGAGVQGKGQEYLAGLQERRAEEEQKRLAAMVKDAKQAYDFINRGDVNNAEALIQDRVQMINRLGGDPSDTARIGSMLQSGNIGLAKQELETFLRPFMPAETVKASDVTEQGQYFMRNPLSGGVEARDVSDFIAPPPKGPSVAIMQPETDFDEEARRGSVTGRLERIGKQLEGSANMINLADNVKQLARLYDSADMNKAEQFLFDKYGSAAANVLSLGAGAEAAGAMRSMLAPQMRPEGSGATSDFEAKQYLNTLPSAIQSPEGRELTTLVFDAAANIERKRLELEDKYLNKEINISQYLRQSRDLDTQSIYDDPEIRARARRLFPELLDKTPSRINLSEINPAIGAALD